MNLTSLSSVSLKLPKVSYGSHINAARDWVVLVVLALLILGTLAVLSAWQYLEGAKADALVPAAAIPDTISPEELEAAESLFGSRAQEALRYQGEYGFVDPSL